MPKIVSTSTVSDQMPYVVHVYYTVIIIMFVNTKHLCSDISGKSIKEQQEVYFPLNDEVIKNALHTIHTDKKQMLLSNSRALFA